MDKKNCCPPAAEYVFPKSEEDANEHLSRLAKALGHPARVAILRLLLRRQACVCGEIVEELPLAQSTVSQHLKILKEAGWIRGDIAGPRVCYCVEPNILPLFEALLKSLG